VVRYAHQTWEAVEQWRTCSWKADLCDCVECPHLDLTPVTSHTHIQSQYLLYLQFTFDLLLVSSAVVIWRVLRAIKLPGTRTFCKCAPIFSLFLWCNSSTWTYAASMLTFLYHTHSLSLSHTHTHTHMSGRTSMNEWPACCRGFYLHNTQQTHETNIHALNGIWTRDPSNQVASALHLRLYGHRERPCDPVTVPILSHLLCYNTCIMSYCLSFNRRSYIFPFGLYFPATK